MYPACIVAAALIGVKATSTGGLMGFIFTKFGPKNVADQVCSQTKSRSDPFERLPSLAQREKHSYGGTVQ